MYFIGKENQRMVFEIICFYIKCMFKSKINRYEKTILEILDEYNYILEYKKEWSKYND